MRWLLLFTLAASLAARQPQMTVLDNTIWLVFHDEGKVQVLSTVHGAGRLSKPVVVAEPGQAIAGVLIGSAGNRLAVAWYSGDAKAPKLTGRTSADQGKTWGPAESVDASRLSAFCGPCANQLVRAAAGASEVTTIARPWGGTLLAWQGTKGLELRDIPPNVDLPRAPASRTEIMAVLEREMYGKAPAKPARQGYELREKSEDALGGKAIRKQVTIWYEGPNGARDSIELLLYLPKTTRKVPVFLGMSFGGNQCANLDPAIFESTRWQRSPQTRGGCSTRWEAEYVVSRGYAIAIVYYGDLDPDFDDGFENGVHKIFGKPKADEWRAVAAWAWGLSRAMDYLEQDPQVDSKHVAVNGHSRIGKAALWAGAIDERFAMVISNDSGAGGAALNRRKTGERIADLNRSFPHWFAGNFVKYNHKEEELPFDSHWVLIATAPRLLYVASASEDLWADPEGEFEALLDAGMRPRVMPKPGERYFDGRFAYHLREGKHDITKWDWEGFIDFAEHHRWRE